MTHATVKVSVGDDHMDVSAYLAGEGSPGVLLLPEIFGVGEFVLAQAERLHQLGYTVFCPDVFWRLERNVALPHDDAGLAAGFDYMERYAALDVDTRTSDLVAALAALRAHVATGDRVGVMGYCLGGTLAYEVAVASQPDCCVAYYGAGIASALDRVSDVQCPVLLHFGGADPFIPADDVAAIQSAFAAHDDVEVHIQDGAGHAFENSYAPSFSNPKAAAHSWPITVEFLGRHLH